MAAVVRNRRGLCLIARSARCGSQLDHHDGGSNLAAGARAALGGFQDRLAGFQERVSPLGSEAGQSIGQIHY
jgi:hypothetical protein